MRTDDTYIRTFTGKKFWPLDPKPEDICITDIAHALSQICRYTGHSRDFYSVGAHSLIVAATCRERWGDEVGRYGLLHDAAEAYLLDMARPVKYSPDLAAYRAAERSLQHLILRKFGIAMDPDVYALMKSVDDEIGHAEMAILMNGSDPVHAVKGAELMNDVVIGVTRTCLQVERRFLQVFCDLFPGVHV
jgi:hypothetical protein